MRTMEPRGHSMPAKCPLPDIPGTPEMAIDSAISTLKDTAPDKATCAVDPQTEMRTEPFTGAIMKHNSLHGPAVIAVGGLVSSLASSATADLPPSPVSTPDASIMSDPFSFTTASSFTSTSSSMVVASQPLKSILKNAVQAHTADLGPEADDHDGGSSEESDSDMHDAIDCDDEGEDEDEDESDNESESEESDDDDISCDGSEVDETEEFELEESFSFISFGNSVRFAESETVVIVSSTQDRAENNMTCHERMLLAQAVEHPNRLSSLNGKDYDPEEHSRDVVDLDKELLFAYINGLNTIDFDNYKPVLQSRTLNSTCGDIDLKSLSGDTLTQLNEYFDRIVETLLGLFPNLFTEDEYNGILDQARLGIKFDELEQLLYCPESANVQQMLRDILEQKLKNDTIVLKQEVLGWLAGELVEPLGRLGLSRQSRYACNE